MNLADCNYSITRSHFCLNSNIEIQYCIQRTILADAKDANELVDIQSYKFRDPEESCGGKRRYAFR